MGLKTLTVSRVLLLLNSQYGVRSQTYTPPPGTYDNENITTVTIPGNTKTANLQNNAFGVNGIPLSYFPVGLFIYCNYIQYLCLLPIW